MVRVNLQEVSPSGGYDKVHEMAAVPREGENIFIGEDGDVASGTVCRVLWTVGYSKYDVQVRFR